MPRGKYGDISFALGADEQVKDGIYVMTRLAKTQFSLTIPYRVGERHVAFPTNLRSWSIIGLGLTASSVVEFSDDFDDNFIGRLPLENGGIDEEAARKVTKQYVKGNFDRKHFPMVHEHRTPVEVRIRQLKPKLARKSWEMDEHAPLNALFAEGFVYHVPTY